ncbi:MAG TPA: acetylornithine/succinylornithine family transaminase [Polyangiaceae bacterium]
MGTSQSDLCALGRDHLYPNYRQAPIVIARGEGALLWDADGKRYLDMVAGIAVSSLGHAHPRLSRAIAEQAARVIQVSNYYYNEPNVRLAQKLCALTGMDRAFFCNSGTEAIEASVKLVRRHFYSRGQRERLNVLAFSNSFHGRTLGALAVTGQEKYREGFGPLPGTRHVPYGDLAAARSVFDDSFAAVVVEPIQGEGGVVPAPAGFLGELRALCDERGAFLVADEIQTGVGRTGTFLGCEADNVRPDVVVLAKGLGGGVPIGAMLCRATLAEALPPGSHGSTFGGNALASAAALAVLETLESENLLANVRTLGDALSKALAALAARHPDKVESVRGKGLLQAVVLKDGIDARAVLGELQQRGVLLSIAGGSGLRFSPPLVVRQKELEEAVAVLDAALGEPGAR